MNSNNHRPLPTGEGINDTSRHEPILGGAETNSSQADSALGGGENNGSEAQLPVRAGEHNGPQAQRAVAGDRRNGFQAQPGRGDGRRSTATEDLSNQGDDYVRAEDLRNSYRMQTARHVFFNINSLLFLFSVAIAGGLTFYSKSGLLVFDGHNIWWKVALFQVELELLRTVFFSDAIGCLVEYVVTRRGISSDLLSHAMGAVTPLLGAKKNWFYKFGFTLVTVIRSVSVTLLVTFVLVPNPSAVNRESVKGDVFVQTNCIGGRYGKNYGATGQMLLFNASAEKFKLPDTHQTYGLYIKAATRHQIFTPKIPQIGPYSTECNSIHQEKIVEARVLDVQGLLYDCEPKVRSIARGIEKFPTPFSNTSPDTFRILNDTHKRIGNSDTLARLHFRAVIAKQIHKVAMFELTCTIQAAETTIDVKMSDDGVMGLSLPRVTFKPRNLTLPRRVLGDLDNNLDLALENAIGARGIAVVDKYVATGFNSDWEGLVYWIVTAYGVRSALKDTFADTDDRRRAINVRQLSTKLTVVQVLRIFILWIPIGAVLLVRLLSLRSTNMFTGNVKQMLDWITPRRPDSSGDSSSTESSEGPTLTERLIDNAAKAGPDLHVHIVSEHKGRKALRFRTLSRAESEAEPGLSHANITAYKSGSLRLRNTHFGYRDLRRRE